MARLLFASLFVTACHASSPPAALPPGCDSAAHHALDFWLGAWDVTAPSGRFEGTNEVTSTLEGCAIEERWVDARGHRGNGLFYVDRATGTWKQVWLTDEGPNKEKRQVAIPDGVRFEGEVATARGLARDRTTLTRLPDGRVRQVIEQSLDDGKTWSAWEGIYTRRASACEAPRDFAFWIGEWSVAIQSRKSPDSEEWVRSAGANRVRVIENGCAVEESFVGAGAGPTWTGASWSVWLPREKRWRQTWIDDGGNYLAFRGGMTSEGMTLTGEPAPDGKIMRMVFFAITPNAFAWRWEATRDGGATWRPMMRIDYTRIGR